MDIVKLAEFIAEKASLSESQARKAVRHVLTIRQRRGAARVSRQLGSHLSGYLSQREALAEALVRD